MIRKDGQNKEWNASTSSETSETNSPTTETAITPTLEAIRVPQSPNELTLANNSSSAASKFTASLKAFEINKRQKMEKINKSTLARLARVEFENARRGENNNDNEKDL